MVQAINSIETLTKNRVIIELPCLVFHCLLSLKPTQHDTDNHASDHQLH